MKVRLLLSLGLFFSLISFFSLVSATEEKEQSCFCQQCESMTHTKKLSEKIYINPEDVLITEHGIFALDEVEEAIPVLSLHHDEQGLYFKPMVARTCGRGHLIVCSCGGCIGWQDNCLHRCRCIGR